MKHRIETKYETTCYFVKSRRHQQIDEAALRKVNSMEIPCLLKINVLKRKKSFRLIYNVTGLESLENFLKNTLTKEGFVTVQREMLKLLQILPWKYMEFSKINFDMDSIFVNPCDCTLYFIYIPICGWSNEVTEGELLRSVAEKCQCSSSEGKLCRKTVCRYLQTHTNISLVEFENLLLEKSEIKPAAKSEPVSKLVKNPDYHTVNKCPFCKKVIEPYSVFCAYCGERLADERGVFGSESQIGTVCIGVGKCGPYIVHTKTGEQISVSETPFSIGRDRNLCSYCLEGNATVGRKHAEFTIDEGRYFICDNNSVNHTYVNGQKIEPGRQVELFHGTRFRLANEDFEFFIG